MAKLYLALIDGAWRVEAIEAIPLDQHDRGRFVLVLAAAAQPHYTLTARSNRRSHSEQ